MQQPPYAMTPPLPPKSKMPVWGWVLLGCTGAGCLPALAILAAIVFPVFAQAREKARQTACLSNQKQIGLSLMMYAQDNDGCLPPASKWMDVTEPYMKAKNVYHCPKVLGDKTAPSYAFDETESGKNTQKMTSADQHIIVYDSTLSVRNAHDNAGASVPVPGRHKNGNNYTFADGHAKWVKDNNAP